jgi:hypothetical protein
MKSAFYLELERRLKMDYKERFKNISTEQKRKDLMIHPMVNHEAIKNASDEDVEEVYFQVFSSFDMAMQEVIGESMFDDDM